MLVRKLQKPILFCLIALTAFPFINCRTRKNVELTTLPITIVPLNPKKTIKLPGEVKIPPKEPSVENLRQKHEGKEISQNVNQSETYTKPDFDKNEVKEIDRNIYQPETITKADFVKYEVEEISQNIYQPEIIMEADFDEEEHICGCGEIWNFTEEEHDVTINFYHDDMLVATFDVHMKPLMVVPMFEEMYLPEVETANKVEVSGLTYIADDETTVSDTIAYDTVSEQDSPAPYVKPLLYYDDRYTFNGILRQNTEDLCETGEPHTYYYIEIDPIDMTFHGDDSEFEEPRYDVTELQLRYNDFTTDEIGKPIKVSGILVFNIAGCRNHTEAYLEDVVLE